MIRKTSVRRYRRVDGFVLRLHLRLPWPSAHCSCNPNRPAVGHVDEGGGCGQLGGEAMHIAYCDYLGRAHNKRLQGSEVGHRRTSWACSVHLPDRGGNAANIGWWLGNKTSHWRAAWAPTGHRADWGGDAANALLIGSRGICATTWACRNIWSTNGPGHCRRWRYH